MKPVTLLVSGPELRRAGLAHWSKWADREFRYQGYVLVGREPNRDMFVFGLPALAPALRLWHRRWVYAAEAVFWLVDKGVLSCPEGGYMHEARPRSPHRWFHSSGWIWMP